MLWEIEKNGSQVVSVVTIVKIDLVISGINIILPLGHSRWIIRIDTCDHARAMCLKWYRISLASTHTNREIPE